MKLTRDAQEEIKKAPKDWATDVGAQEDNRRFLKNMERIRKIDELKYRYDVIEGEIMAVEFQKQQLPSKIKCHVFIFLLLCIFTYMMYVSVFSFVGLPFYVAAVILEIIKAVKVFMPHILNLPGLKDFCAGHGYKSFDVSIEEKRVEQREIKRELAMLESELEAKPTKGEDMIS